MTQYIDKDALVAKIRNKVDSYKGSGIISIGVLKQHCEDFIDSLDTIEVKEADVEKERMEECPYRQVACTMYEGEILECRGACSWVVDYQKLKELKSRKEE